MRLTQVVFTQHIGRMFKKHWKIQGQRVILETGAEKVLKAKGIPVYRYEEVLNEIPELESKIVEIADEEPLPDERSDPLWHDKPCHFYKNHSSLLEGLDQAKILTKTVEVESGLPQEFEMSLGKFSLPNQHNLVKSNIMTSHVFDATQEKLPKLHDPERPAWVFPRVYGITDKRRNRLMGLNLFNLCQLIRGPVNKDNHQFFIENGNVSVPLEKDGDLLQLECRADLLVATKCPLPAYADEDVVNGTEKISLPSIHPIKHTVSLPLENIYQLQDFFPITPNTLELSLHTAVIYYNETEVVNLYDLPVTETQFLGRSLVHAFTLAASQARHKFGSNVSRLERPVTLQSVHTDGRRFHFSVFQLNTMDLNGTDGIKNIIWMTPIQDMFESCGYQKGKPELVGYNDQVFERLLSFYANK